MEALLERYGAPLCRDGRGSRLSDLCHFRAPLVTDSVQAFAAPLAPAGATRTQERRQNPGQGRRRYREAEGKGKEGKGKGKAGRKG